MGRHVWSEGRWVFVCWPLGLIVFYVAASLWAVEIFEGYKRSATEIHNARLDPSCVEPGRTPPDTTPPPGAEDAVPTKVRVGLYLDRVIEMSAKTN